MNIVIGSWWKLNKVLQRNAESPVGYPIVEMEPLPEKDEKYFFDEKYEDLFHVPVPYALKLHKKGELYILRLSK